VGEEQVRVDHNHLQTGICTAFLLHFADVILALRICSGRARPRPRPQPQELRHPVPRVLEADLPVVQHLELVRPDSREEPVSPVVGPCHFEGLVPLLPQRIVVHGHELGLGEPELLEADDGGLLPEELVHNLLVPQSPLLGEVALSHGFTVPQTLVDGRQDVERRAGEQQVLGDLVLEGGAHPGLLAGLDPRVDSERLRALSRPE